MELFPMLHSRSWLFAASVAALLHSCAAEVVLENNRYSGIVVAIDPNGILPIPEEQEQVIDGIKDVMTKASEAVFEATNHRAYFSDVKIVIPEDWSVQTDNYTSGSFESWRLSDIRIVNEGRHNSAPMTIPGGGCGIPGANMEVPLDYVTEQVVQAMYGETGRVMAAEWLKYRYGVYEEHGYPGDSLYPHAYLDVSSNQTRPTGCTNHEVLEGTWKNSNGQPCDVTTEDGGLDPGCRFTIDDTTSDYSIMYITHTSIPGVTHVCDAATHDPAIPTRHNILCNGKSIWDIIMQHADFADGNNPADESKPDTTPSFTIAMPSQPALYLIIDDNCGQKAGGEGTECPAKAVYTHLKETVRTLLTSSTTLPRMALRKYFYGFSGAFNNKDPLLPLDEIDVDNFMDFFPTLELERHDNITSPELALTKALDDIATSDFEGQVDIFLVQMIYTEEDGTEYPELLLEEVSVTGVLYGDTGYNPWMQELTQQTQGKFFFDPNHDVSDVDVPLLDLIPEFQIITLLQVDTLLDTEMVFEVYVDSGIGIDTTFTVEFTESGGEVTLTDSIGTDVPAELPSTVVPDAVEGKWSLTIKNTNNGMASIYVTSRPRPDTDQIEVKTWTSASSNGEVDLSAKGLVFYVSVTQGNIAIRDLEVTVRYYPGVGAATHLSVTLLDDGLGNPDVQKNDGIYSAYVTDFGSDADEKTIFFADVSVTVASPPLSPPQRIQLEEANEKNIMYLTNDYTKILPQDPFAVEPCCGSVAPDAIPVAVSRGLKGATSVVILNGPGNNPYDPPPSQVTGAAVSNTDQDGPLIQAGTVLVSLSWKAPGKDFTAGTVTGYEIWYSESKTQIVNDFTSCTLIQDDEYEGGKPVPGAYGSEQTVTIRLPKKVEEDAQYYLVVVGLDGVQRVSEFYLK
ncbi:hypothetical protein SK128_026654 [Halocaridina rubra]|uniref:Calcium-activated chloride channel N-terminal domain-containing protein n=1 Tax=Halocaridina rubra TaxID=373956 RepID=A0AAN9AHG7_HALRR